MMEERKEEERKKSEMTCIMFDRPHRSGPLGSTSANPKRNHQITLSLDVSHQIRCRGMLQRSLLVLCDKIAVIVPWQHP